ncbi:unnamed protein product [Rotaria sp. Silwood1]|nr:unnamed protein product [Rotaria sp. Silwood1]
MKAFTEARSTLCKLSAKREKLHEQEKKAQNALHDANVQCENLSFDPTASKTKISNAKDNQTKRQNKLDEIQQEIERAEQEYDQEYENYRAKAMDIYEKCRALEKERLDLLGETLIKFNDAAFSSEYSTEEHKIFEDLKLKLKVERDSLQDLDFWAKTYHVYDSTTSLSTEKKDLTIKEENTQESVAEGEEEQSQADTITTTTKTKSKKNKNNTKTESTTTNAAASNQVS